VLRGLLRDHICFHQSRDVCEVGLDSPGKAPGEEFPKSNLQASHCPTTTENWQRTTD